MIGIIIILHILGGFLALVIADENEDATSIEKIYILITWPILVTIAIIIGIFRYFRQ